MPRELLQRARLSVRVSSRCWRSLGSRSRFPACAILSVTSGRPFPDGVTGGEFQYRRHSGPELEIRKEPVFVGKAEREKRSGVRARLIVLPQEDHGRPSALIDAPRSADGDVIEEFDVERSQREVTAESSVDPWPEAEILKQ